MAGLRFRFRCVGMARMPRLDLPRVPQHVVQRGNNRSVCFAADEDYLGYRGALGDAATHCGCAIHAYVLMTNHVHLLVTGLERGAVSRMMQRVGRCYVARFNARYRRTGTLWEGRFKSSLVDSERYLLACHRYIELNPVRAAMVARPVDYRWSSYRANGLGAPDGLISPHPCYLRLGPDAAATQTAYRQLFENAVGDDLIAEIRVHTRQQKVLGGARFHEQVAVLLGRTTVVRSRGRPRLDEGCPS